MKDARFRVYDERKKTKLTVYKDYSLTLNKLRMNSATQLMVETKADHEEFEEYDPDWVFLKVVPFNNCLEDDTD